MSSFDRTNAYVCMPTQVFACRAQNKTNERKTEKETIESRRKKVEEVEHDFFFCYIFIYSILSYFRRYMAQANKA